MKKVAVMLTLEYRGGTLRAAKNIAKQIAVGAALLGDDIKVVFSYIGGDHYDKEEDFVDLIEYQIETREMTWMQLRKEDCSYLSELLRIPIDHYETSHFSIPRDGANDFYDCDHWIIISDRVPAPILPLRKYTIVAYDYIQRYVPEIFTESQWSFQMNIFLPLARNAEAVFVTTPSTRDDVVSYAGVPKEKVVLFENSFDQFQAEDTDKSTTFIENLPDEYFIWPTNTTQHKNHISAFKALEKYYSDCNGAFTVVVTGGDTKYFDPHFEGSNKDLSIHPYIKNIRNLLENNDHLRKNLIFLGELTDSEYLFALQHAKFIWHPNLYDNGTFGVIEAAYLNVPALSSRYPAMEYINEIYELNMRFFDPHKILSMAKALKDMEISYNEIVLPAKCKLLSHSWYSNATVTYKLFRSFF